MNKKKLGSIAALSLAAITAVPTFSIVASADLTVNAGTIYQVTVNVSSVENGQTVVKPTGAVTYYATKADADKAIANLPKVDSGKDDADGNDIMVPGGVITNSNANLGYLVPVGGYVIVNPTTGQVTVAADGGADAGSIKWTGTVGGGTTTTPGTNQPPENPPTTDPTTPTYSTTYTPTYRYYSSTTGRFYSTWADANAVTSSSGRVDTCYGTGDYRTSYSASYPYYYGGRYYRTWADAYVASNYNSSYINNYYNGYVYDRSHSGSVAYPYYSSYTQCWYRTWSDAVADTQYCFPSLSYSSVTGAISNRYTEDYSTTYSSTYPWYSSYTRRFYRTESAALAASNNNSSYVSRYDASSSSTYSAAYSWYSSYTRRYYQTYAAAMAASNNNSSYVRQVTSSIYTDPYYYYYGLGYTPYSTTTTTRDTSNVTIGNLKGWTSVIRTINNARSGAAYTVNMKTETEIPSNVLKALKGKNVTINFKFSNGAVFSLNGNDISSTSAISPTIRYGSTSIPSSLKKKAVKTNDGVSSSQFSINGGSFGASASVTVKFNAKRAGCSAKLYRYNASANTLSLVSRSTVGSSGQCKFDDVKQGGEYLVVLS